MTVTFTTGQHCRLETKFFWIALPSRFCLFSSSVRIFIRVNLTELQNQSQQKIVSSLLCNQFCIDISTHPCNIILTYRDTSETGFLRRNIGVFCNHKFCNFCKEPRYLNQSGPNNEIFFKCSVVNFDQSNSFLPMVMRAESRLPAWKSFQKFTRNISKFATLLRPSWHALVRGCLQHDNLSNNTVRLRCMTKP